MRHYRFISPQGGRRREAGMRVRHGLLQEEPAAPEGLQAHQEAQGGDSIENFST